MRSIIWQERCHGYRGIRHLNYQTWDYLIQIGDNKILVKESNQRTFEVKRKKKIMLINSRNK